MDVTRYWLDPPAEPSSGLVKWLRKIHAGWLPNRRIGGMGYHEAAEFYQVYIWEYLNILQPLLECRRRETEKVSRDSP